MTSQYGDDDERSLALSPLSDVAIHNMIKEDIAGYDEKTTQTKLNTMKSIVTNFKFIVSTKANVEDNGTRTLTTLLSILKALGKTICQIVLVDFEIATYSTEMREQRTIEDQKFGDFSSLARKVNIVPDKEYLAAKAKKLRATALLDLQKTDEYQTSNSKEKTVLIENLNTEYERIENDAFVEAYEKYHNEVEATNEAISHERKHKANRDKLLSEEIYLTGIMEVLTLITTTLKTHVQTTCPSLMQLLKANVTIPLVDGFGGENTTNITNPWDNNNLSGIFHILKNEYHSGSLVSFASLLLNTINYRISTEDSTNDPEAAVRGVETLVETWLGRQAFRRMTMDWFFTVILINSFKPDSEIRTLVTREVNRYMKDHEGQEVSSESMATLQHAKEIIKSEMQNKKMGTVGSSERRNNNYSSQNSNWNKQRYHKSSSGSLEEAHLSDTKEDEAHKKLPGSVGNPIQKIYNGPITALQHKQYYNPTIKGGKTFDYIAVTKESEICNKCYGPTADPSTCDKVHVSATGKCYSMKCRTCGLYGHPSNYCQQRTTNKEGKSTV